MGALSPTQNIIRFRVEGALRRDIHSDIMAGLKANMFTEPLPSDYEDIVGWVPFADPFTETFDDAQVLYGTVHLFALRIDRKTIPAKAVEQLLAKRIKEKKEEQDRDFISKNEKAEIKEIIVETLWRKTPYTPQIFEFTWDVEERTAYLYSTQKKAITTLENLFLKSFGHRLFQLFPFVHAVKDMDEIEEGRIKTINPMKIGG